MDTETKITIDTFKTVTKAIAQSDNLDIMSNHLTQLLVAALNIKGCAIFVLNPDSQELELFASFGLTAKYLTKGPLSARISMAETSDEKPVVISDVTKDKKIQYPEEATREGIKAILAIPVIFSGEVIGSLRLYHHQVWNISDQDLDSLYLLAENIGLAMTYTRLLNAIQSIVEAIHHALPTEVLEKFRRL